MLGTIKHRFQLSQKFGLDLVKEIEAPTDTKAINFFRLMGQNSFD